MQATCNNAKLSRRGQHRDARAASSESHNPRASRPETGRRWLRFDGPHHVPVPRFLLYTDAAEFETRGRWRFALNRDDGSPVFAATDEEAGLFGERLALLAVVRGLEALEQPSHVEVVTTSAYVRRGIAFGVSQWRASRWKWELFGRMVPVKHADLWRRIDRAMRIHHVVCRRWTITPDGDVPVAVGKPGFGKPSPDRELPLEWSSAEMPKRVNKANRGTGGRLKAWWPPQPYATTSR